MPSTHSPLSPQVRLATQNRTALRKLSSLVDIRLLLVLVAVAFAITIFTAKAQMQSQATSQEPVVTPAMGDAIKEVAPVMLPDTNAAEREPHADSASSASGNETPGAFQYPYAPSSVLPAVRNTPLAGLTGTKNIPGDYATLALAVSDLNTNGVGVGGVTFNLLGGNPQTAPAGGYVIGGAGSLVLTSSSAANPIVFTGNGNTITAFNPQTVGALNDGIFKLIGADFVTIQGFTLQENPLNLISATGATNNMTEWGVALLYASLTDGSQNNTIQNNTISLNRTYLNTFGIYSNTRHSATAIATSAEVTAATGSNSGNKVYGNNISNVNYGIIFIGAGAAVAIDNGNDIGGASAATGNTITNWGGGSALSGYISLTGSNYCIFDNQQINDNVSFNTITSAALAQGVTTGGFLKNYSAGQPTGTFTTTINNNTVTVTNNPTAAGAGGIIGINNQGLTPLLATATMSMNNNTVQNSVLGGSTSTTNGLTAMTNLSVPGTLNITGNTILNNAITATSATTGILAGITNSGAAGTVNMTTNVLRSMASSAASGQMQGIVNSGAVVTALNINNNQLGNSTSGFFTSSVASSGVMFGIVTSGGAATCALSIQTNDIRGITYNVAATSNQALIQNSAATLSQNISGNTFTNLNINTTGQAIFISNSVSLTSTGTKNINSNQIVTAFNKAGAGSTVLFYNDGGPASPNGAIVNNNNNNFSNVTVTGATTIQGWSNVDGASSSNAPTKTITGNTFNNINGGTGTITALQTGFSGPTTVTGNTISNITSSGVIIGLSIGSTNGQGTHNYSSNTITNLTSNSPGGGVNGIQGGATTIGTLNVGNNTITGLSQTGGAFQINPIILTAGTTVNVFKNKIANIQSNNAGASINGIAVTAGTTYNIYNNLIGDLRLPTTNAASNLSGILINAPTTANVYYNTVYLNATSSGAVFGSSAIFSSTATTTTLRNNVFVNASTPNTTGLTVAYLRSSAVLTNYGAASNNNDLYAGIPGPNNLIFNDGTNSDQTLADFKTRVSPRDSASVTENPPLDIVSSSPSFLHVTNATGGSQILNTAAPIGGFVDDYDADARDGSTPDMGADEVMTFQLSSPTYSIAENGGATATITVTRTAGSAVPANINYATSAGTATPGTCGVGSADYTDVSGTLNFSAGQTSSFFAVPICDDAIFEADETVNLSISSPTGGSLLGSPNTGTLTITNDEATPVLNVTNNATVTEGNAGTTLATFNITLAPASSQSVTVHYSTQDNSATVADNDYVAIPDTLLTFNPGETSKNIDVTVNGDTNVEPDEQFFFNINNPLGANISDNQGIGTITNDDTATADYTVTTTANSIVVSDVSGNSDTLTMSEPSNGQIKFAAPGRFFSVDGGPVISGDSGNLNYSGIDFLTVNQNAGNDQMIITTFVHSMGEVTINGGTGNDTVHFNGTLAFQANRNLDVDLQNDDPTPGVDQIILDAGSNLQLNGVGTATLKASQNVVLNSGSLLQVSDGDANVEGNRQAVATVGDFNGVDLIGGTVQTVGAGNVFIKGTGGAGDFIENVGVRLSAGGKVHANAAGALDVQGTGGNGSGSATAGQSNLGVYMTGLGSNIDSNSSAITVTGTGGTTTDSNVIGITLDEHAVIETDGAGTLTITGNGGTVTGGGSPTFVNSGGIFITPGDVNGNAGLVTSTGTGANAGAIIINGTATNGGNGAAQGVRVDRPGAVTTVDGPITITGTAAPCGNACLGTSIRGDVTASGTGAINITGTGAATTGVFPTHGVNVRSTGVVSAVNGNITITGTGGNTTDNAGFNLASSGTGKLQTTGTGNIIVNADIMRIGPSVNASIDALTNTVTLQQKTNTVAINLGSPVDTTVNTLELSDSELDRITAAGAINIGNASSGAITVSAPITRATATNMVLTSGANIDLTSSINSNGGDVTLVPATNVFPSNSGVDVTTSATKTLTLTAAKDLKIVINTTTVDSGYTQLNVAGLVNLNGANLALSGTLTPAAGQQFIIVNNDSNDPITGTFNGLPEGAIIPNFLGSALNATITYAGGSGNDAMLTVVAPVETSAVVSGGNLVITDINGGTSNDALTLSLNGTNVRITDPGNAISAGAGVIQVNANTVEVPLASITGNIQVNTLAGDDLLTLNFSGGNFLPAGGLNYAGGTQTSSPGDKLAIVGGSQGTVTYNYSNLNDGNIVMSAYGTITYTGLEPISNTGVATDIIFNMPPSGALAILEDDGIGGNGISRLNSAGAFETTDFVNPTGSVTVNGASAGDMFAANSAVDFNASLAIGTVGNPFNLVAFSGPLTLAANKNLSVEATSQINIGDVVNTAALTTTGTGTISIKGRNIIIGPASGTNLSVVNGNLTLTANGGSGNFSGINISGNGSSITTTGTGNINLNGTGGNDGSTSSHLGIVATAGSAILSTSSAANAGTITLNGFGGTSVSANKGVSIVNSGISSKVGDISITGHGQAAGTGDLGVEIRNGATVSSTGAAKITIDGTPGIGSDSNNAVLIMSSGTQISSTGGDITVTGHAVATTGTANVGVVVQNAAITGTGLAKVKLDGTGGAGSSFNLGVLIAGTGAMVSSDADIQVIGHAGGAGNGATGVGIRQGAKVVANGTANLLIDGTGANGTSACYGVGVDAIAITGTTISAVNGNITINGTAGTSAGADMDGVRLENSASALLVSIQTTGTGSLTINGTAGNNDPSSSGIQIVDDCSMLLTGALNTFIADTMDIGTSNVSVNTGSNAITLRQKTNNRAINLGGADSATQLGLTDAELDVATAGTLNIGDGNSGSITVSAPITRATATNMVLTSGANIDLTSSINSNGGDVTLVPATNVFPSNSGVDVTTSATKTLTLTAAKDLKIVINTTTVDSGYTQLNVAGLVNLNGANLALSGTLTPAAGQQFIIVNNDSNDPITGTFNGLPEGAIISNFLGSTLGAKITYVGGTNANDVVLTVVAPEIAVEQPAGNDLTSGGAGINFGSQAVGFVGPTKTFTIKNVGSADLTIGTITTVTGNNTDFTVDTTGMTTPVTPGNSTTFTVRFTAGAVGPRNTTLRIPNNDGDENPFDIALSGNGVCPSSFTVNDAGDTGDITPGDGTCATGTAVCTLRAAIEEANALSGCGTIDISVNLAGTLLITNGQLSITHSVNINGPGAQVLGVMRSGAAPFRIFNVNTSGSAVSISGLTISNGDATPANGGGILNAGSGTVTLLNSAVSGNTANGGGGLSASGGTGTLTVINSTINNNTAVDAGGILASTFNVLNLINSTVSGNNAVGHGGGMWTQSGTTIINSTITNNRADIDNDGSGLGGGIYRDSGLLFLRNTIVAGNFNDASPSTTRDDINGPVQATSANNLIGDGTGMTGISQGSNGNQVGSAGSPINPLLLPLQNNGGPTLTHSLQVLSPAIDSGDNCVFDNSCTPAVGFALTTDQRGAGFPRKANGNANPDVVVDIGAFEKQTPSAAVAEITGHISSNDGSPVEGAVVRLSGSQSRMTITDAAGNYRFDNVEANGFYNVTPSRVNFTFNPAQRSFSQTGNHTDAAFDASANGTDASPLDTTEYFVRQQYLDFLGREPDEAGLTFWVGNIQRCGSDANCVAAKRIDTSAAFFLSIEFQQTGYLVYRTYQSAYGNLPGTPVPLRLSEFKPDTARIGRGVIVNEAGWEGVLEANKQSYMAEFVRQARFVNAYPGALTPGEFVDRLFLNASVTPASGDRAAGISEFGSASTSADLAARGRALRRVAENSLLERQQSNRAFVLMQYFGYLLRDANAGPDADFSGYNFWLEKLNSFNGDYRGAEMVKAFLVSGEYRGRFRR